MRKFLRLTPRFFVAEFGLSAYTCTIDMLFGIAYFLPYSTSNAFYALQDLLHAWAPLVPVLFFINGFLQWYGVCSEQLIFAKIATAWGSLMWIFMFGVFDWYNPGHGNLAILFGVDLMMIYSYVMLFLRYMTGYRVFYRHESFDKNDRPGIDQ